MSEISTVVWDIGGVLLTNGWDHVQRNTVIAHFGLDLGAFEARHAEANDPWEKDLITVNQYLDRTVFYQPRDFTSVEFIEQMKAQSVVLADSGIGILRKLAASQELEIAVLNNEARELNDYRLDEFGILQLADSFFSSCYVGLRKPGVRIFQLALDVLQRDPEHVAFIDDRAENVAAAASVGIRGIRYEGSDKLAADLENLGIKV